VGFYPHLVFTGDFSPVKIYVKAVACALINY